MSVSFDAPRIIFDVTKSENPPGTIHDWGDGPHIKRDNGKWDPLTAQDDGKEVGPFGPIYRRFYHKPEQALKFLQEAKDGEAVAAIEKEGIGDIDFVWGKPGDPSKNFRNGYGIAHIIARREAQGQDSAQFLKDLPNAIRDGEVIQKAKNDQTLFIRDAKGPTEILIRLNWFGERKIWLLTGYYTESEKGGKALKSRIGILQGYPESMDAVSDLPTKKDTPNQSQSQQKSDLPRVIFDATFRDPINIQKARRNRFPLMCDYCKDWSTHNPILRVFPSYEAFARSPFYGGGDAVINDQYAEFAVWPGKTNATRHYDDWWICVPVHPNCSHGYQPWEPPDEEFDFSDTFSKVDDEIRAEQDRAAEARKSAFYVQGVWHEATCACNAPEVAPPEGSWVREYLMKSRFKMEE